MYGALQVDLDANRITELNHLRHAKRLAEAERARLCRGIQEKRRHRKQAAATLAFLWLLILYVFAGGSA